MLLKNKNVIITGATRGIGKGIALEFAKQGANIIFTYSRSHDEAKKLEDELNNLGVKAISFQSDASKFDDAHSLIDKVLLDFDTIDVLINNAGITKDNLLMRMQESDFDTVIDVNLKSVFNMTKAVQ